MFVYMFVIMLRYFFQHILIFVEIHQLLQKFFYFGILKKKKVDILYFHIVLYHSV